MALTIKTAVEKWPIAGSFRISRGSKTEAVVVVVEISDGKFVGRGECVPYARYGETVESVLAAIDVVKSDKLDRATLQHVMPQGAARNAIDCAFWDLEAKRAGKAAYELASLDVPMPLIVPYTISLDDPEKMAEATKPVAHRPLLKIKLGAEGDAARLKAVRAVVPNARLIVDVNEGWTADNLASNLSACADYGVECIEQPLPAAADGALAEVKTDIAICADESVFDRASLAGLIGKYRMINVKLDKTGGLTEALATANEALKLGFELMVGCMVSTSLSMAPAILVAQKARIADLDGALLLAKDRENALRYDDSLVYPPTSALWG